MWDLNTSVDAVTKQDCCPFSAMEVNGGKGSGKNLAARARGMEELR